MSQGETQLSKGDYLKKFQTLMYVNSKYFNLQKFFENKKQLKMKNSEENFEQEMKLLSKKRKKRKLDRLRREDEKSLLSPFNKFRIFRKRKKKSASSKLALQKRYSSIERKKPLDKLQPMHEQNVNFLAQSCVPLESPAKRFSVLHSLLLEKKREAADRSVKARPRLPQVKKRKRAAKAGASLFNSQMKSQFIATSKIKSSINTIRQKRRRE